MKAFLIIEIAICAIMAILVVTQIILPTIRGRPLFPLLRSKVRDSEGDLLGAREDLDLAETQREVETLKQKSGGFPHAIFNGESDRSRNSDSPRPARRRPQRQAD